MTPLGVYTEQVVGTFHNVASLCIILAHLLAWGYIDKH